jgi:hypothetical protein
MKTKTFAIISIFSLLFFSCNEIDKLLTFTISNQTSFKISSGFPVELPNEVATPDVATNSSTDFKNNNTRADLVKDVKLEELKLSITSPEDKTFGFLKSVHLYISTTKDDEIELAYLNEISSTAKTINLICTDKKLDHYIKASSYKIRTQVTTKETLTKEVAVQTNMKFKVTANPF